MAVVTCLEEIATADALERHAGCRRIGQGTGQQHAHVLLGGEDGQRLGSGVGRDHDFEKELGEVSGGPGFERTVDRHDTAEDRHGIAGIGFQVGGVLILVDGHAAGVGVLHHDDGGLRKLSDALIGRLGVADVVVGELLALDHARSGDAGPLAAVGIERGLLVRVLAVAQRLHAPGRDREPLGEGLAFVAGEPAGDCRIVGGRAAKSLGGEAAAQRQGGGALVGCQFGDHGGIVGGIDHHGHEIVVFGRRPDQSGAADVDIFHAGWEIGAARDGGLERVEIHHDEIDTGDAVIGHRLLVPVVGPPRQDAAMDRGLQGFHPAIHDLGKAGVVAHFDDFEAGVAQRLGRAAGREDFDPMGRQRLAKLDQAGLVGDGDQGALDAGEIGGGRGDVVGGGGHGCPFSPMIGGL